MLERFRNYLKNQALINPSEKVLLAISGGVDSVVMCDLCAESKIDFAIAHCQFNLRGEESDQDEQFVRSLSTTYNVPVFVKSFNTKKLSGEKGQSIQMIARSLRYEWFRELAATEGFQKIATAHHLGDVAETMLLNLSRGTGIRGLHGIRPKQEQLIRPLLFATREEIEAYARAKGLPWREDSSNAETKYRRNEIRHEVIPILKKQNPSLEHRMAASAEKIAGAEALMAHYIRVFQHSHCRMEGEHLAIALRPLQDSPAPALVLYELAKEQGFTYEQARNILVEGGQETGRQADSATHRLHRDREHLLISPRDAVPFGQDVLADRQGEQSCAGMQWYTRTLEADSYRIEADPNVAALDKSKLIFPLKIRPWQQGDRFFPLGMRHQKKLSDFMIDEKIPLYLKNDLRVVCSGEDIVWVAGYRIDNRYRITKDTLEVFRIGILERYDKSF